jgi:hypothetical protein
MRSGANYSTWFNGGSRTTTGFHNMVGILTEIIGNPTPGAVSLVLDNQLPRQDLPLPIPPQTVWRQRQSIDYIMSVPTILDVASKHREDFLYRIYKMGRNSIGAELTTGRQPTGLTRRRRRPRMPARLRPGRKGADAARKCRACSRPSGAI